MKRQTCQFYYSSYNCSKVIPDTFCNIFKGEVATEIEDDDMTAEVHEDEESKGETTEEEPDFSSEYEPETETDTASENEDNSSQSGNRYIISVTL